jgi:hypothetical protein
MNANTHTTLPNSPRDPICEHIGTVKKQMKLENGTFWVFAAAKVQQEKGKNSPQDMAREISALEVRVLRRKVSDLSCIRGWEANG